MKHLRIDAGKGQYSIDGEKWIDIDRIVKSDLLKLIDLALGAVFEMDPYVRESIPNPAHDIIYRNLFSKLNELVTNKDRFRDESQQLYRESLQKYRAT